MRDQIECLFAVLCLSLTYCILGNYKYWCWHQTSNWSQWILKEFCFMKPQPTYYLSHHFRFIWLWKHYYYKKLLPNSQLLAQYKYNSPQPITWWLCGSRSIENLTSNWTSQSACFRLYRRTWTKKYIKVYWQNILAMTLKPCKH